MSWIGGKKSSRDIIIPKFPLYYEKYIEVFGGGGGEGSTNEEIYCNGNKIG